MNDRTALAEVANAVVLLHAMLIDELDRAGALSKAEFSKLLQDTAKSAEETAPNHLKNRKRLDLEILRSVARNLDVPRERWQPVVLPGGRANTEPT